MRARTAFFMQRLPGRPAGRGPHRWHSRATRVARTPSGRAEHTRTIASLVEGRSRSRLLRRRRRTSGSGSTTPVADECNRPEAPPHGRGSRGCITPEAVTSARLPLCMNSSSRGVCRRPSLAGPSSLLLLAPCGRLAVIREAAGLGRTRQSAGCCLSIARTKRGTRGPGYDCRLVASFSRTILRLVQCWLNCHLSMAPMMGWAMRIMPAGCEYTLK